MIPLPDLFGNVINSPAVLLKDLGNRLPVELEPQSLLQSIDFPMSFLQLAPAVLRVFLTFPDLPVCVQQVFSGFIRVLLPPLSLRLQLPFPLLVVHEAFGHIVQVRLLQALKLSVHQVPSLLSLCRQASLFRLFLL